MIWTIILPVMLPRWPNSPINVGYFSLVYAGNDDDLEFYISECARLSGMEEAELQGKSGIAILNAVFAAVIKWKMTQ